MSTSTLPKNVPTPITPSSVSPTRPDRILLTGIRWETYEALLKDIGGRSIRLTYDRGALEIMAPTFNHERSKRQLGRIVETVTEEMNLPVVSGGSTTFRQEGLDRGLEPDDCFYIQNALLVLGKTEINLEVDPSPDLAIEIDITTSFLNRLGINAALKISEIWRFNGQRLQVFRLKPDQTYEEVRSSPTFPKLPLDGLTEFLHQNMGLDDNGLVRAFRAWFKNLGIA